MPNTHKFRAKMIKRKKKGMRIKSRNKKLLIKSRKGSVNIVLMNNKEAKIRQKNNKNQGLFLFSQESKSLAYFMDYQMPQT